MPFVYVLTTLFALVLSLSCGGGEAGEDRDTPPVPTACAPGELTLPDGRCQPAGLPPDMPCPPGERALPTSADGTCQAAGVPAEACAAGFLADGRGGCAAILPEEACPPGLMAVPGERACREVSPCGAGTWGNIPVEVNTQYVDQGYAGNDSDGSRERPWRTVQAGVRAAASGAIVAVAEGRYEEDVLVSGKPVRVWGRCPARTEVAGLGAQSGAIVITRAGASGSEVRELAVTGPKVGVAVRGAPLVVLEGLWVHEPGNYGVVAAEGAGVTLRGALIEQSRVCGVAIEGSEATVEATVVRATQLDGAGKGGNGINVQANPETGARGKLQLTATLVEENHQVGVFVGGDSEARVEATVVRGTQPNDAGEFGYGVGVQASPETGEGGKLWLTASLVEENHAFGVFIEGSEARVEATVVRATQPDGAGTFESGIGVQANPETGEGGKLWLTASLVEENHAIGVFVEGSEATVEATVVRATQPDSAGKLGRGINVQAVPETGEGGKLWLTASRVEENQDVGVFVGGSEATVDATVVRGTQPNDAGEFGYGISVQASLMTGARGKLRVTASLVEENHAIGVFIEGSEARVEATVVRATQPDGAGEFGRGIGVQSSLATGEGGKLWLTTSLVEENHDVGVFVLGSEATVETTVVRTTKRAPAGQEFGDGVVVLDERGQSHVTLAATASTDNARAGVLYVGSTGELSSVRSSGNRFGLVLQPGTSGAQPTLGEGNRFEGNTEQDELLGGDLPVPDAVPPLP